MGESPVPARLSRVGAMTTETVTILFTDLVGSTALLSRAGEERAEALRREHFAFLREVFAETGGREVKNLGDGLMVAFPSPSTAVGAAVVLQQRLDASNRRSEEPMSIRIGISVGEADLEEEDYFGPPVVESARLCAVAEGGQILTTEMVRLMTGTRGGHQFESLGELQLKGLDTPVGTWSVSWERSGAHADGVPLPARL